MNDTNHSLRVRAGVFDTIAAADRAVFELSRIGFDREHITVVAPKAFEEHFAALHTEPPAGDQAGAAAGAGGAIGAVLGGLGVVTLATATGGLALIGVGPLALAAATGGVAGGFVGAMMTRGVADEVADYYDQALERGQILVAADVGHNKPDHRLLAAEEALRRAGAEPVPLPQG
jgi:hypothetical protein